MNIITENGKRESNRKSKRPLNHQQTPLNLQCSLQQSRSNLQGALLNEHDGGDSKQWAASQ